MKYKVLPVLMVLLSCFCTNAQETLYLGVRLAGASSLEAGGGAAPYLGLQLGVRALEPVDLRVSYDVSLGLTYASADLLYTQPLSENVRAYTGIGPDYYTDGWNGESGYGLHGTVGLEYRTGLVGLFAEAQPIYGFAIAALRIRFGLGVNFHF